MPDNQEQIELRSEEVQEILSFVPNWMIRWGNTLFFGLILGLLLISWFVKYPDVIASEVLITTSTPPEKIYANRNGQLDAILAADNEDVAKDKILAIVENSSNYEDVILLKNIIDTLQVDYNDFYFPLETLSTLFLGDVESDFALFERSYTEYKLNKELKPLESEYLANQLSLAEARNRLNTLIAQQGINRRELELKRKDQERYKSLYEKGIISTQEFDQKQLDFLQAQRSYRNNNSAISQLREAINNSKRNLRGTEIRRVQDDNKFLKNTIQSFNQLKKSLKTWELNYVLKSSIAGRVSFLSFWDENQTVRSGDLVFTVVPTQSTTFLGKIKAPARNSGKIKKGQQVNIKLLNYPYEEFGMIEGAVSNISLLPDAEGNYLVDVELDEKLTTTYNKEIEFKQEMIGKAEIITEDLRLIERFFYQLRTIFDK